MADHGELAREEREGEGEGGEGAQLGAPWGAWGGAARSSSAPAAPCSFSIRDCLLYVREESRKEEEEEKKKKRKEKQKKRKNGKISNLKIFREKNKRQFMKLVKIIFFVKERYMPNYK
jgi:hypothetical protein